MAQVPNKHILERTKTAPMWQGQALIKPSLVNWDCAGMEEIQGVRSPTPMARVQVVPQT